MALALAAGGCLDDALDPRSAPVRWLVLVALGVGWTAGLVALLVPRASSLTAVRLLIPGGLTAMAAATAAGGKPDGADLVALVLAALAVAAVLAPWFTEAWVDGSSYGPERRLPLATPPLFSFVIVPLTFAVVAAGVSLGPLLLAARQWPAGVVATAAGAAVTWVGVRSLHQLARRWVVLVPSGMVLHDPITMPEAQLFPRVTVAGLGPAPADSDAVDLTAGATGLAIQIDLREPVELLVRTKGRAAATLSSTALMFTPARPGRLLDAARSHRIAVATAAPSGSVG